MPNIIDWVAYKQQGLLAHWRFEVQDQGASMVWDPHMAEGAREVCGISLTRALIPFMRAPPS